MLPSSIRVACCLILFALAVTVGAQPVDEDRGTPGTGASAEAGRFGAPNGFGGGPGGFGGPQGQDVELLETHDRNGDGWLNQQERAEGRKALANRPQAGGRGGRRGFGGGPGGGRGGNREPAQPGPRVSPNDVETYPDATLYDTDTLRTVFLNFENDDWEAELQDFHGSDVDVPATMTVDGESYPGVGVHFRGASSYMMVPAGFKRSLNVSVDFIDEDQRLYGYKTLNLLNCNGDASMMSTVLYSQMAGPHMAVPKANFVKVVINGEYWGVYVSVQQFDKVFTAENFGSSKGTRWKVPGSPRGDGGLGYLGDDLDAYKSRYDMKSNDGKKAWNALIELTRVLNETPTDQLVEALEPILDVDEALWFLAFDVALVNSDGYWTRASDYSMFRDRDGRFHMIPHDMNEAFHGNRGRGPGGPDGFGPPEGAPQRGGFGPPTDQADTRQNRDAGNARNPRGNAPDAQPERPRRREAAQRRRGRGGAGGPGQGGGGGVTLDPLVGLDNGRMPLRSRLLAVPELRERYMEHVREIAQDSLDWDTLGPQVARYRALIQEPVKQDTRKLDSYEAFLQATANASTSQDAEQGEGLQAFAQQRRAYLLSYPANKTD